MKTQSQVTGLREAKGNGIEQGIMNQITKCNNIFPIGEISVTGTGLREANGYENEKETMNQTIFPIGEIPVTDHRS